MEHRAPPRLGGTSCSLWTARLQQHGVVRAPPQTIMQPRWPWIVAWTCGDGFTLSTADPSGCHRLTPVMAAQLGIETPPATAVQAIHCHAPLVGSIESVCWTTADVGFSEVLDCAHPCSSAPKPRPLPTPCRNAGGDCTLRSVTASDRQWLADHLACFSTVLGSAPGHAWRCYLALAASVCQPRRPWRSWGCLRSGLFITPWAARIG